MCREFTRQELIRILQVANLLDLYYQETLLRLKFQTKKKKQQKTRIEVKKTNG